MTERYLALVESNTTGTGQLFARAARALGLRPVLLTSDPNKYPYVIHDDLDVCIIDTNDPGALHALGDELAAAGLVGVTSSSEYFIAAAAELAERYGLVGPASRAIRACRDKAAQRRILADAGVPVPAFAECRTTSEVVSMSRKLGSPVVVKPVQGSGSEGVRVCDDVESASEWSALLLATTTNERGMPIQARVLVEEYLDGPEYSVESFDGNIIGITAKHLGPQPFLWKSAMTFLLISTRLPPM